MNHFTYGNAGSIYSLYAFAPPYEGFPRAHRRDAELPYMIPSQPDPTHESMSAAQTSSPASVTSQEGKSRLRKACDSCSIRKVKCDEDGPPCQACAALDIPCTFDRPSRRRGPPNRHAEAIKRKRLNSPQSGSHISPPTATLGTPLFSESNTELRAESICPLPLLQLLVDDYFTYIHPLIPIPHEPTFRTALHNREDVTNPTILSLLAGMIGALVASFPRKPRIHLRNLRQENIFPSSMSLISQCHRIAAEARGSGYLEKELTVYDAATSYLLAISGSYTFKWRQSKLYFNECLSILRTLGFQKPTRSFAAVEQSFHGNHIQSHSEPAEDFITQQIGQRIFWVCFVGARSIQQLGGSSAEVFIPPETPTSPYPPLPLEVDDMYILSDRIVPQPTGIVSELVGFNANVRIFRSYEALSVIDMTYGIDNCIDWETQRQLVSQALANCKHATDDLPTELLLRFSNGTTEFGSSFYQVDESFAMSHTYSQQNPQGSPKTSIETKRRLQYEIQKANIYVSQLGSRSHIVEKYWTLCEFHQKQQLASHVSSRHTATIQQGNGPMQGLRHNQPFYENGTAYNYSFASSSSIELEQEAMATEREQIVRDLLMVLSSISQINMEPNGVSLIFKIRMIASTLLDASPTRKGTLAVRANEYLARFLDILMKLERTAPLSVNDAASVHSSNSGISSDHVHGSPSASLMDIEEEAELRHWADLRDYQASFVKSGGFFG